jgi:hypothetical protein
MNVYAFVKSIPTVPLDDVTAGVLALSVEERWFDTRSAFTKVYEIGIYCVLGKHEALGCNS